MELETESYEASCDAVNYEALRDRLGVHLFRQRLNVQASHAAQRIGQGRTLFHPENIPLFRKLLKLFLKGTFLWPLGYRNACNIQVRENVVRLRRLPDAFMGVRILQLSDLHLDLDRGLVESIQKRIEDLEYDICVITGDFRAETHGNRKPVQREIDQFIPKINPSFGKDALYAILGNHDDIELASSLEKAGARVLLNESVSVCREDSKIYIAGVDDPHFYETDSLEHALTDIPPEATTILLSHSAEIYRKALSANVDYMLCGHTHAGQICLPGGIPIIRNAQQPGYMSHGPWQFQGLHGYTASGAGCSMIPVRFFCPAEVTIHVLERGVPDVE